MEFGLVLLAVIWAIYALFVGVTNFVIQGDVDPLLLFWLTAANYVYVAGWGAVMVWLWRRIRAGTITYDQFFQTAMRICTLGMVMLTGCFWVFAPALSERQRFIVVVALMAFVMAAVVGTLRVPTRLHRGVLGDMLPFFFPIGVGAWFVVHPDGLGWAMAGVIFIFGGLGWLLRAQATSNMRGDFFILIENERLRAEKARFLAAASHDLDQPLSSAQLFFEQLSAAKDDVARSQAGRRLERAFNSLKGMTEQVTRYLQLEAGAVVARRESVAIAPLLLHQIMLNESRGAEAGVELRTLPFGGKVMGDALLIERVLNNYVVNAIRHAKARRILLGAKRHKGRVRLYVIDDGVGVPEEERANLFDDFVQGSHHGEERGGFGLGLASVRRMAVLMHGHAGIDPHWERGCAFFLELEAG